MSSLSVVSSRITVRARATASCSRRSYCYRRQSRSPWCDLVPRSVPSLSNLSDGHPRFTCDFGQAEVDSRSFVFLSCYVKLTLSLTFVPVVQLKLWRLSSLHTPKEATKEEIILGFPLCIRSNEPLASPQYAHQHVNQDQSLICIRQAIIVSRTGGTRPNWPLNAKRGLA